MTSLAGKRKTVSIVSSLLCLALFGSVLSSDAEGRTRRNDDLLLFSKKYQPRIIEGYIPDPQRVEALRLWSRQLRDILSTPRKKRPSERDLHEQFFTDVFVNVLGFEKRTAGQSEWTIASEYTTDADLTRPDGMMKVALASNAKNTLEIYLQRRGFR